jgi:hypothetical protein
MRKENTAEKIVKTLAKKIILNLLWLLVIASVFFDKGGFENVPQKNRGGFGGQKGWKGGVSGRG